MSKTAIMRRTKRRRRKEEDENFGTNPTAGGQVPLSAQVVSSSSWQVGHLASGAIGGCLSLHRVAREREGEREGERERERFSPPALVGRGSGSGCPHGSAC